MKLEDLLPYISEHAVVRIIVDGKVVSCYDGKNSVDKLYNNYAIEEGGISGLYLGERFIINICCHE